MSVATLGGITTSLAVDDLDGLRVGVEVLQQPCIPRDAELPPPRPLPLLVPQGRARPRAAAADRAVVMFDPIASPLVGRDPVVRRCQGEIVLRLLIGAQCAALRAERAGAAGD